jgi:hypothetical protein
MKIDSDVKDVLSQCKVEDGRIYLPQTQLDRKLYTNVNKVFEALGFRWDRKTKAHISDDTPDDLEDKIAMAINEGQIAGVNGGDGLDFFETPPALVAKMFDQSLCFGLPHPCSNPEFRALEPSAGKGAILKELIKTGCLVDAVEYSEERSKHLRQMLDDIEAYWVTLWETWDFLTFQAGQSEVYDYIYMNPPFSKRREIDHVNHALDLLKTGGLLVAIMSPAIQYRSDKKTKALKERLDSLGAVIVNNDPGSFKTSGTMVQTIMVYVKK